MLNFFLLQGAKNHGVIMPDANKENCLNQVRFEELLQLHVLSKCMYNVHVYP